MKSSEFLWWLKAFFHHNTVTFISALVYCRSSDLNLHWNCRKSSYFWILWWFNNNETPDTCRTSAERKGCFSASCVLTVFRPRGGWNSHVRCRHELKLTCMQVAVNLRLRENHSNTVITSHVRLNLCLPWLFSSCHVRMLQLLNDLWPDLCCSKALRQIRSAAGGLKPARSLFAKCFFQTKFFPFVCFQERRFYTRLHSKKGWFNLVWFAGTHTVSLCASWPLTFSESQSSVCFGRSELHQAAFILQHL